MTEAEQAAMVAANKVAVKEAAILKSTLSSLGVTPETITSVLGVFKDSVTTATPTAQEALVVKNLLTGVPNVTPVANPTTPAAANVQPASTPAAAPTAMETLMVAMATKLMGDPAAAPVVPGANVPNIPGAAAAPANSAPASGFTKESIQSMTPDQINANWESISGGLANGQIN